MSSGTSSNFMAPAPLVQQNPAPVIPDSDKIAAARLEKLQRCNKTDEKGFNAIEGHAIQECIRKHNWALNLPNHASTKVTSPENFMDILARLYILSDKMKDKFMPTQSRIDEYRDYLSTGSYGQNDANWKFYTSKTFEYFASPTTHGVSGKTVHGLFKKLSAKDKKTCQAVDIANEAASAVNLRWDTYGDMTAYQKAYWTQAPVTPFEDSYNIILTAHVKVNPKPGEDAHHGRDTTYRIVTNQSCSITKDVVFRFVYDCPGCAARMEKSALAHQLREGQPRQRGGRNTEVEAPAAVLEVADKDLRIDNGNLEIDNGNLEDDNGYPAMPWITNYGNVRNGHGNQGGWNNDLQGDNGLVNHQVPEAVSGIGPEFSHFLARHQPPPSQPGYIMPYVDEENGLIEPDLGEPSLEFLTSGPYETPSLMGQEEAAAVPCTDTVVRMPDIMDPSFSWSIWMSSDD